MKKALWFLAVASLVALLAGVLSQSTLDPEFLGGTMKLEEVAQATKYNLYTIWIGFGLFAVAWFGIMWLRLQERGVF